LLASLGLAVLIIKLLQSPSPT